MPGRPSKALQFCRASTRQWTCLGTYQARQLRYRGFCGPWRVYRLPVHLQAVRKAGGVGWPAAEVMVRDCQGQRLDRRGDVPHVQAK